MDLAGIRALRRELAGSCTALEPDAVPLPEVVALWGELDQIVRLAGGAKLRLLRRLDDARVAAAAGDRSTADWAAKRSGTSVRAAREALEASRRLAELPSTDEAVARGELSDAQASLVSDAAAADPTAERSLLDAAGRERLRDLQERCATTKANATDPGVAREAIRRGRYARTFRDGEGGWNLHVRHLPEVGAEIEALLAPFTHARFENARRDGDRAPHEAYAADAVLDLARASTGNSSSPKGASRAATKVFVHVDAETLRRGSTASGSTCHIAGVGPVDPAWVRSILGDSFLALLVEDAEDVRAVCHLGRQVTARQRTALEARGYHCEVPGCGSTFNLEIDHRTGWAITRTTVLDDLVWMCGHHHDLKTNHGWTITGSPGRRSWHPPPARAGAA